MVLKGVGSMIFSLRKRLDGCGDCSWRDWWSIRLIGFDCKWGFVMIFDVYVLVDCLILLILLIFDISFGIYWVLIVWIVVVDVVISFIVMMFMFLFR